MKNALFWWAVVILLIVWMIAEYAHAHDPYTNLKNSLGTSCCGAYDCHPLDEGSLRIRDDGEIEVKEGDNWFVVPEQFILRDQSIDGRAHSCPMRYAADGGFDIRVQGIRCLIMPQVM